MSYRAFIIAGFLIFTHGCSDSNNDDGFGLSPVDPVVPPASPIEPTNSSLPEWLYVQTAATAQMTSDTILEIPFTRDVFGFTDIPNRKHAYFTASEFEQPIPVKEFQKNLSRLVRRASLDIED